MNKRITTVLFVLSLFSVSGCYINPTDVGRKDETSFEAERRKQEELIIRQQAVIERQQRELKDIERQRIYDQHLEVFNPKE